MTTQGSTNADEPIQGVEFRYRLYELDGSVTEFDATGGTFCKFTAPGGVEDRRLPKRERDALGMRLHKATPPPDVRHYLDGSVQRTESGTNARIWKVF